MFFSAEHSLYYIVDQRPILFYKKLKCNGSALSKVIAKLCHHEILSVAELPLNTELTASMCLVIMLRTAFRGKVFIDTVVHVSFLFCMVMCMLLCYLLA